MEGKYGHKTGLVSHLERLEGKADMVALSHSNLPDAHFVGPIVIRVVGRLDLPNILLYLSSTDGCMR